MNIKKNEVLAIIPARGSSKGLPRKNSRVLVDKPLIAWTIENACKAKTITRVVVSTDDTELADIAIRYGAEVPFLRPKELAKDNSVVGRAIDYTLGRLTEKDYHPEYLVELYPTSPFRTTELIDSLTEKLFDGYTEVITVKQIDFHMGRLAVRSEDGRLRRLGESETRNYPSNIYRPYGQYHGWRLLPHPSERSEKYIHIIKNPIELVDIDYAEDFRLAEYIISNNLYKFE